MILLGEVLVLIGLPTAIVDMMMNGSRYAHWAPLGLGMAFVGLVLVGISG